MKITYSQALSFKRFAQTIEQHKFPLRTAFRISVIRRGVETNLNFYFEELSKLLEEYAVKDENGKFEVDEHGNYKVIPDKIPECNEKINALLNFEFEIEASKLALEDLESLELSVEELASIYPFIEE
jgi:hypothetical protein